MIVTVKKATNATSSKTGKDFQIVIASSEKNEPIKFFAGADEYKVGDRVELYIDYDYNFMARVAHRRG